MSTALATPDEDPRDVSRDTSERALWERQKGETAKQWAAFCVYRNLPPDLRSIRRAANEVAEASRRNATTVFDQFREWSSKRSWVARAEAFDVWRDRVALQARETERQRIDREQQEEGRFLRRAAMARIRGAADDGVQAIDLNEMDAGQAARLYALGRDTERTAAGLGLGATFGTIPLSQARQILQEVFDVMIEEVPDDRRSTVIARVQGIVDGGGR